MSIKPLLAKVSEGVKIWEALVIIATPVIAGAGWAMSVNNDIKDLKREKDEIQTKLDIALDMLTAERERGIRMEADVKWLVKEKQK